MSVSSSRGTLVASGKQLKISWSRPNNSGKIPRAETLRNAIFFLSFRNWIAPGPSSKNLTAPSTRFAKTVSNHSFLPFSSTVTLIQELRSSIRDHVAREKELGDSHALKKYHLNKAHAELLENHDLENQARHEQAAKGFEATLEVATTINADRASRIERAREAVELQLQDALNQQEGGGTFSSPKSQLDVRARARRRLESDRSHLPRKRSLAGQGH